MSSASANVKAAIADAVKGGAIWQDGDGLLVYGGERFTEADFEEAERFRRANNIDQHVVADLPFLALLSRRIRSWRDEA